MEPAPPPKTALGYHRVLSPSAGIRVSPLALGTMNFGQSWAGFMGEITKETVFGILDYYYAQGGNFIDTANNYQNEETEIWLGEWLASRKVRDQLVIATKFGSGYRAGTDPKALQTNYAGAGTKSMFQSVDASLKKLGTSYLDILYVHWWDPSVPIPELMKSLNTLCDQGKVLYLGVSDTPAWVVTKANQYARDHGLRPFVVYQGNWNASKRDMEREIIPMAIEEGMGIAPWGALGGGNFKTDEQRKQSGGRQMGPAPERDVQVSKVLEKVAARHNAPITSIALAWALQQAPNVFPIVGGRKVEHLAGNIAALSIKLSDEDKKEIEGAAEFDYGFPLNFLYGHLPKPTFKSGDILIQASTTRFDEPEPPKALEPRTEYASK